MVPTPPPGPCRPSESSRQHPANHQSPITKNLTAQSPVTARTPVGSIHPSRRGTDQPIAGHSQSRSCHDRFINIRFFRRIGAAVAPTNTRSGPYRPSDSLGKQPANRSQVPNTAQPPNCCSLSSAHDPSESSGQQGADHQASQSPTSNQSQLTTDHRSTTK